ncbi:MAG TPA: glycosyltransferase family 2 protein [Actinobacteria bacterium]|jgi:glycosyltransferase involved in cell wall biosynthesis|nr:glycosyltransferase family 2 protein [Actinomycetota bacterium]
MADELKSYPDISKISILIPSYNEEKHIKSVIEKCAVYGLDIIVVNDGSTDNTLSVLNQLKRKEDLKLIVLNHEINKGKGEALKTGFDFACKNNYFGVITIDADGQHSIDEIGNFITEVKNNDPDIIVGSRFTDTKGMPFIRLAVNFLTSWIISLIALKKIGDVQSGFRFIKHNVMEKVKLQTSNFDTEPELLIKASWHGFKITNIPIKTIYNLDEFKSHISPGKDTLKFFNLVFKSIAWRFRFRKNAD